MAITIENELFASINREFPIIRVYNRIDKSAIDAEGVTHHWVEYSDSYLLSAKQLAEKLGRIHLNVFKTALNSQTDQHTIKLRRGLKIDFVVD